MLFMLFFQIVLFLLLISVRKTFLHKSLVQILTQTPFSLVHFNKYLFRAACRPAPEKKTTVLGNINNHKLFSYLKL